MKAKAIVMFLIIMVSSASLYATDWEGRTGVGLRGTIILNMDDLKLCRQSVARICEDL